MHRLRRDEYTVGWVCALAVELAAAQEMLDEEHETPQLEADDTNIYTCGRIGEHNVVIACLPVWHHYRLRLSETRRSLIQCIADHFLREVKY